MSPLTRRECAAVHAARKVCRVCPAKRPPSLHGCFARKAEIHTGRSSGHRHGLRKQPHAPCDTSSNGSVWSLAVPCSAHTECPHRGSYLDAAVRTLASRGSNRTPTDIPRNETPAKPRLPPPRAFFKPEAFICTHQLSDICISILRRPLLSHCGSFDRLIDGAAQVGAISPASRIHSTRDINIDPPEVLPLGGASVSDVAVALEMARGADLNPRRVIVVMGWRRFTLFRSGPQAHSVLPLQVHQCLCLLGF